MKKYDQFHKNSSVSRKLINENNFTYINLLKIINKFVRLNKNGLTTCLDVGCGVGTISCYLANKGIRTTGIDISHKAINIAKINAKHYHLENNTTFKTVNLNVFDKNIFKNIKYDLVIASEVIEHLLKDRQIIKELYYLQKNGGLLIISVPSVNAPLYKLGVARNFDKIVGHLRRYDTDKLINYIKSSGYEILLVKKTEGLLRNSLFLIKPLGILIKFIKGPLVAIFYYIDQIFVKIFGESQIFIVAKKP